MNRRALLASLCGLGGGGRPRECRRFLVEKYLLRSRAEVECLREFVRGGAGPRLMLDAVVATHLPQVLVFWGKLSAAELRWSDNGIFETRQYYDPQLAPGLKALRDAGIRPILYGRSQPVTCLIPFRGFAERDRAWDRLRQCGPVAGRVEIALWRPVLFALDQGER